MVRGSQPSTPSLDSEETERDARLDAVLARAIARQAESEALNDVARALGRASLSLPDTLRLLVESTCTLMEADAAWIARIDGDEFRVDCATEHVHLAAGERFPVRPSLAGRAVDGRRAVFSNEMAGARSSSAIRSAYQLHSAVAAPLIVHDQVVGVLAVSNAASGAFTEADAALLQRMADHGALALHNAELHANAEQSAREARALGEVVQQINQSLELDRVVALIARLAAELLGGRASRVVMLDGGELHVTASYGPGEIRVGERIPREDSFAGVCVREGKPVRSDDLGLDGERWPWTANHENAAANNGIAAPLMVGDRIIGAIVVLGNDTRDFAAHDESLLSALGSHAAIAIENARLYRASVRTMRHASILATTARSLALNVTPRAMYADIARVARTSLGADSVSIYLADAGSGAVHVALSDGIDPAVVEQLARDFWPGAGGQAVRTGRALFIQDLREQAKEAHKELLIAKGVRSVAMLPLIVEGQPRGLLSLRFRAIQRFDAEQEYLLMDFGTYASVALRNALLFEDLERRAARLAAVAQVQRAISASVSLEEVYAAIYEAVASVVDSPCFTLLGFDESDHLFAPAYVVSDGVSIDVSPLPRMPLADGATSQAFRSGAPNVAARSRHGWSGTAHEVPGPNRIAVVLSAPIVHGDRVLGVLQAQSYRQDAYDWSDVDLIMLVARQAGTAIVNARTFEAERRERQQSEAAAAIAHIAIRANNVSAAAPELLAAVRAAVSLSAIGLAIIDPTTPSLVRVAGEGGEIPFSGMPPARGAVHAVVQLSAKDRALGALAVASASERGFSETDALALTHVAAPLTLALETLLLREEETRQQERQRTLATALETMDQPVLITDPESRIRYANGAATRAYRYTPEQIHGLRLSDLEVASAGASKSMAVECELAAQGVWSGERLHRRSDGTEFPVMITVCAIEDEGHRTTGLVGIVRDLTDERRIAEQFRQSEKLAALGELVAGVAHEVNNPLTGISALAQLLMEDPLAAEQAESVRLIKREADRAVSVIRDLLTFARKTGPRTVSIDLNDLVAQTLRLRGYGLRTAGVEVELILAPDLRRVSGDDRQLQQVILNLVVNAEHAMTGVSRRSLTVRSSNEGDRVVVEIADTGMGMTPEVQKRIFEPFYTTKPEGKGTGLGLSVSYGIVQTHGGTLTVSTTPGAGAAFRIALPAQTADSLQSSTLGIA